MEKEKVNKIVELYEKKAVICRSLSYLEASDNIDICPKRDTYSLYPMTISGVDTDFLLEVRGLTIKQLKRQLEEIDKQLEEE